MKFYLKGILQGTKDYDVFLEAYENLCDTKMDWLYFYSFKFNLLSQTEACNEKKSKNVELYNKIFKKYDSVINTNLNFGKLYFLYYKDKANFIIRDNPDKAEEFYLKSRSYLDSSKYFKFEKYLYYSNLSRVSSLKKDFLKGLNQINLENKYVSGNDSLFNKYVLNAYKADLFNNLKQYDSAYFYEKRVRFLNYKINFQKEN